MILQAASIKLAGSGMATSVPILARTLKLFHVPTPTAYTSRNVSDHVPSGLSRQNALLRNVQSGVEAVPEPSRKLRYISKIQI
jgi:hypothetical protein